MKALKVLLTVVIIGVVIWGFRPGSAAVLGNGRYTVQRGDSLSEIAARHGTTVAELVRLNANRYPSLKSNPGLIEPGWVLVLPGGKNSDARLWDIVVDWGRRVVEKQAALAAPLSRPAGGQPAVAGGQPAATGGSGIVVGDEAAEAAILAMINEERARLGLGALEIDEGLRARARERSRDMLERGYVSHYDPVTGAPLFGNAAEVIAAHGHNGWGNIGPNDATTTARNWWSSPPHYAAITNGDFHRIGIGVAYNSRTMIITGHLMP